MVPDNPELIKVFIARLNEMDLRLAGLEERVSVMETNTINHESRLQELEEKEDKRDETDH